MGNFVGGAAFIGLNLLVVLAPALVALWLGVRIARALERSARAQEQLVQRVSEMALSVVERSRERDGPRQSRGL